jgi:hypothetical protein
MKKRKLGSKNPKYNKEKNNDDNITKELIQEVKGVKIYTVKYDNGVTVRTKK